MRFVVFMAGAAMALSYFVTWLEPPFAGAEISPAAMIGDSFEVVQQRVLDGTWQLWVFLGGFVAAVLSVLVSLIGRASALLALLAGGSPVALGAYFYTRADEFRRDIGLPFEVDFRDINQAYELVGDFVRAGLWMYVGGAGLLLLAGLVLLTGRH